MTTTRRSVRSLQTHRSLEDAIDATFLASTGVGSVIVIGSIGALAWNGENTCIEFFSLDTICSMELLYMGGGCIVLGLIAKGINLYYFPPLKSIAALTPIVKTKKEKKPRILGKNVKTRDIQSTRRHDSEKQSSFWKKKSKAVMNSITAGCSHIFTQVSTLGTNSKETSKAITKSVTTYCSHFFTQVSTLATNSPHWLIQSRSTLSSTLAWGQSKFFSNTNSSSSSSSTSRPKRKKKPYLEELSSRERSTSGEETKKSVESTKAILEIISPAASIPEDFHNPSSTEGDNGSSIFSPVSTTSTSEGDPTPISLSSAESSTRPCTSFNITNIPATSTISAFMSSPTEAKAPSTQLVESGKGKGNPISFSSSSIMSFSAPDITLASTSESSSVVISTTSPSIKNEALSSSESSTTSCASFSTTSLPATGTVSVYMRNSIEAKTPSTQLVESGGGWVTSWFLMRECLQLQKDKKSLKQQVRQLQQQGEDLRQRVNRAERHANYLAGVATQLSHQLSRLFFLFRYPYYAPFPSGLAVHQPPPASVTFLTHPPTPQSESKLFTISS